MNATGFVHERTHRGAKDEWLTPPEIVSALGVFDLDPCSPVDRPWPTARNHFDILDDGLSREWTGRVWLNPPYGPETGKWLSRLADHGNGIALIFARTETRMFHQFVWTRADALLFPLGRICFYHVTGEQSKNAAAPSVLVAYGHDNIKALRECGLTGRVVDLREAA